MSITSQVLLLIVIILISGFLSMSEISLAASTKVRLQVLAEHGDKRARTVLQFKEHPGHFVTVVQIGINMCAIISGFIGEDLFSPYIAWPLKSLGLTPDTADTIGSCTSFILVTFALVVFSDLIPKRLSFAHPEKNHSRLPGADAPLTRCIKSLCLGLGKCLSRCDSPVRTEYRTR